MANQLLEKAAHQKPATTKRGALERLFTLMFQGFVYNQIWEDPVVDLAALDLKAEHRLITIASGGCNVLNYLAANPAQIIAVDLNPNHIALTKLKLSALQYLPNYESFFHFFGRANDKANKAAYDRYLRTELDDETREYWEKSRPLRGKRINMFGKNLYRYQPAFIGILLAVAKLHGKKLEPILSARTPEEQRRLLERDIAPLFEFKSIKLLSKSPVSLYALGIPPAQYDELVAVGDPVAVLRERVERLAAGFPINENCSPGRRSAQLPASRTRKVCRTICARRGVL